MSSRYERYEDKVEHLIREAQKEGKFSNLANEGKPLKIQEDNPFVAPEWRMAYKIAEDGGYVPPWIELDKEVEQALATARHQREEHRRWVMRRLENIKLGPTQNFVRDVRDLYQYHQRFLTTHRQTLLIINQKIDTFNAHCPVSNLTKSKLFVDDLLKAFDRSCPAIPEL